MNENMVINEVYARFIAEKLSPHWQVDETEESFDLLLEHIEKRTNFRRFFEESLKEAFADLEILGSNENLIIYDIGSGVSWTSAIMAKSSRVRKVYAIESSQSRLEHAQNVIRNFLVPEEKIDLLSGTFSKFVMPEKADMVVLCASFHHCHEKILPDLFSNIKQVLKPRGLILLANEHYVNWIFIAHRLVSVLRGTCPFSKLSDLRAAHPFDGEHWWTRNEISRIFSQNGFRFKIRIYHGDLCKDKHRFINKIEHKDYYAILYCSKDVNL